MIIQTPRDSLARAKYPSSREADLLLGRVQPGTRVRVDISQAAVWKHPDEYLLHNKNTHQHTSTVKELSVGETKSHSTRKGIMIF